MTRLPLLLLALGLLAGCPETTTLTTDGGIDAAALDRDAGIGPADAGQPDTAARPDDAFLTGVDAPSSDDAGSSSTCAGTEVRCGSLCADVSSDVSNCGGCGRACADGEMCVAGVCGGGPSMCPPGTLACGADCRDVSGDPEFCGSCTRTLCADDEVCSDGACTCRPGLSRCGMACVDTRSDPDHCGGCNMPCATVCTNGLCGPPDACMGEVCDGACIDPDTSVAHCGGCGNACAVDQVCVGGECFDYEPAAGCTSCGMCGSCPRREPCCELPGYGPSCIDARGCL